MRVLFVILYVHPPQFGCSPMLFAEFLFGKKTPASKTDDLTRVDRKRMEKALAAERKKLPAGLTREQKRQFILANK